MGLTIKEDDMAGKIIAVSTSSTHTFSKKTATHVTLLKGLGVEGDAHCGVTVKHRSRVAIDPSQPNLRQVHLIQSELFDELSDQSFSLSAGDLGENLTTRGLDLLALPAGTKLHLGARAIVVLTGLRNPCAQIDHFQSGLLKAVLGWSPEGKLIRKTGVMSIVERGGPVAVDDDITVTLPPPPYRELDVV